MKNISSWENGFLKMFFIVSVTSPLMMVEWESRCQCLRELAVGRNTTGNKSEHSPCPCFLRRHPGRGASWRAECRCVCSRLLAGQLPV